MGETESLPAVRSICEYIEFPVTDGTLQAMIDGDRILQKFVWKLKSDLQGVLGSSWSDL